MIVKFDPIRFSRSLGEIRMPPVRQRILIRILKDRGIVHPSAKSNFLSQIKSRDVINPGMDRLKVVLERFNRESETHLRCQEDGALSIIPRAPLDNAASVERPASLQAYLSGGQVPPRGEFMRVLAELERLLGKDPANASALLLKARILYKKGLFFESESVFRKLVKLNPADEGIKKELSKALEAGGNVCFSNERFDAAHRYYSEALKFDRTNKEAARLRLRAAEKIDSPGHIESAAADYLKFGHDDWALDLLAGAAEEMRFEFARSGKLGFAIEQLEVYARRTAGRSEQVKECLFKLHLMLSEEARGRGDLEEVLSHLNETLLLKDSLEVMEEKANVLYELKRYNEAYEFFSLLEEIGSPSVATLIAFGKTCLELNKAHKAELIFSRVLESEEGNIFARFGKGKALFLKGDFSSAKVLLDGVQMAVPEAPGLLIRARILLGKFKNHDGIKKYDLGGLDIVDLRLLAGAFRKRERWGDAFACYERILELSPKDFDALKWKVHALYKAGEMKASEEMLYHIHGMFPEDDWAFSRLITLLKKEGKREEILKLIDEKLKKGKNAEAYFAAASQFKKIGDRARAIEYFEKTLEIKEDEHIARIQLIRLLIAQNDLDAYKEALLHCEEGLRMDPGRIGYLYEKGSTYLKMNRKKEAIETFLEIDGRIEREYRERRKISSKFLWARIRLAEVHMDLGDAERCRLWLNRARELNPAAYGGEALAMIDQIQNKLEAAPKE